MDYYIDITVLPDPEFKESVLINALYAKLHRALGKHSEGKIGVSFPQFKKNLGPLLRLHGNERKLGELMASNWLAGMRDYTKTANCQPVPTPTQYRTVKRVQAKSAHNKRQRSIAKGWLSEEQARETIPDTQQKHLKLPYAQIRSLSNRHTMRVYIEHGKLAPAPSHGLFNTYGLSGNTTIPWF